MASTSSHVVVNLEKVQSLESKLDASFPAPPRIEAFSAPVSFELSLSQNCSNYCDRKAYNTPFMQETEALSEMETLLQRGESFISILYSYRSCSKALPMLSTTETDDLKREIHTRTFRILRPEINKLNEVKDFCEFAVRVWTQNLQYLVKPEVKRGVPSDPLFNYLIKIIDMLIKLDALKDMKACLLNDFSRYKRAFHSIRAQLSDGEAISEEIQALHMFLGNPEKPHNYILWRIKTEAHKIQGFEDVLVSLIDQCLKNIDNNRYILPDAKHSYYRVLIHLLYLIDSPDENGFNVFKNKKVKLDPIIKAFRMNPVLPLYGDMQIQIEFILERCQHWDVDMRSTWIAGNDEKLKARYNLANYRTRAHSEYTEYSCRFQCLLNEIKGRQNVGKVIPQEMLNRTFDVVIHGFRILSAWSSLVMEQAAFKYSRPIDHDVYIRNGGKAESGSEYEKVVKFKYSEDDLYALGDFLGMIKGLGSLLQKAEIILAPILRRFVHDEIQDFVQTSLSRPLRKAYKRKRNIKETMLQMREIIADWTEGKADTDDYKQRKAVLVNAKHDYPRRAVAPTITQIHLLRRLMHTIFSEKAPGMQGGFFTEKDLKPEWVDEWTLIYNKSFFFIYALDYSNTLTNLVDMSHLWFREFYLEMTKCVQFPIEMSLPWILTEYIIDSPALKENLLFPLDIYNDAAERALSVLGQQFLYDEIEAEINLAFDQLVYNLAMKIFSYYKKQAALILLDKTYKTTLFAIKRAAALQVTTCRYWSLLEQQNVSILGRSVDLNSLLAQHLTSYIRQNIEFVISKFESNDLSSIIELESQLLNIQLTHALVSKHCTLDPFNVMFTEVNDDVSIGVYRNRIVIHVFSELISDLLPNYIYNSTSRRFVRGPQSFVDQVQRDSGPKNVSAFFWYGSSAMNRVYDAAIKLTKGFFGIQHVESLLHVLEYTDIPLVIDECLKNVEYKVSYALAAYAKVLLEALPPLKIPDSKLHYGVVGAYGFFEMKLKYIASYDVLRSEVFQIIREIGNSLAFINLVEAVLTQNEVFSHQQYSYFLGVTPCPIDTTNQSEEVPPTFNIPPEDPMSKIISDVIQRINNPEVTKDAENLTSRAKTLLKSTPNKSIFSTALARLSAALNTSVASEWTAKSGQAGMIELEKSKDFARLCNVLHFIFCMPTSPESVESESEDSDIQLFGDGWAWGVATLLYLLGLHERFDLLDFVYHILNLQHMQPADFVTYHKIKKSKRTAEQQMLPALEKFVVDGTYMRQLFSYIFSILESFHTIPKKDFFSFHCTDDSYRTAERQPFVNQPFTTISQKPAATVPASPAPPMSAPVAPPPPAPPATGIAPPPPPPM